jgi:hypothetical protein
LTGHGLCSLADAKGGISYRFDESQLARFDNPPGP